MGTLSMRFNGIEDYARLVDWLKEEGNTHALADEIRFQTPFIIMPSMHEGTMIIRPGDWIAKGEDGNFYIGRKL